MQELDVFSVSSEDARRKDLDVLIVAWLALDLKAVECAALKGRRLSSRFVSALLIGIHRLFVHTVNAFVICCLIAPALDHENTEFSGAVLYVYVAQS